MKSSFHSTHDYHFQENDLYSFLWLCFLYCFDFIYKHEWKTWECDWKIVEVLSRIRISMQSTFWLRAVKFTNCIGCVITFYLIGNQRKGVPSCIKWKLQTNNSLCANYVAEISMCHQSDFNHNFVFKRRAWGYNCQFSTCSNSKFTSSINTFIYRTSDYSCFTWP